MGTVATAARAGPGRRPIEWPTWLALAGCYGVWAVTLWQAGALGWLFAVPAAISVAFHSSLQHEVLHGHPTRSAMVNEALVFPAVGLFIPFRRFRDLHLTHHRDERLTDPFDDPETFYMAETAWGTTGPVMRLLLAANATFAGRMLIGPGLAMWGFWRSEARRMLAGDRAVQGAWLRHVLGAVPVVAAVWAAGVPLWAYVLFAACPGMSLIMVRSYIEHRAVATPAERTAIVDAGLFWRLLFLNNNFHAVHHTSPTLAWYRIPARWRAEREAVLARNGGYLLAGYSEVVRRWLWRQREPLVHPLAGRLPTQETPGG